MGGRWEHLSGWGKGGEGWRRVGHFLIEMGKHNFGLSSCVKRSAWDTCPVLE